MVLTRDCRPAGVTWTPSVRKVTGVKRKNDMTVITEKTLMASRDPWSEERGRTGKRG
jgi:hypothetical protein